MVNESQYSWQSLPLKDCGLKVNDLSRIKRLDGSNIPDDWTVLDVCNQIVKPATESRRCRFVEYLHNEKGIKNKGPLHFVSHTWSNRWNDTVRLVKEEARRQAWKRFSNPNQGVWIDILAINQWTEVGADAHINQSSLLPALQTVVNDANHGIIVVVDAEARIFTRIWCLYEMFMTGMGYDYMVRRREDRDALTCGAYSVYNDCCYGISGLDRMAEYDIQAISVEHAQATVPVDLERIREDFIRSWVPLSSAFDGVWGTYAVDAFIRASLQCYRRHGNTVGRVFKAELARQVALAGSAMDAAGVPRRRPARGPGVGAEGPINRVAPEPLEPPTQEPEPHKGA